MDHLLNAMKEKFTVLHMLDHRVYKVNHRHNLSNNRHLGQEFHHPDNPLQLLAHSRHRIPMGSMGAIILKVLGNAGHHLLGKISFLFNLVVKECLQHQATTHSRLFLLVEWQDLQRRHNLGPCGKVEVRWDITSRADLVHLHPVHKDLTIILDHPVVKICCFQTSGLVMKVSGNLTSTDSSHLMCLPLAHHSPDHHHSRVIRPPQACLTICLR